jgi:O-methyltransferase involved in polyketide biosynthesis
VVERPASSTAVLVCQGRAIADWRYAVGVFSDPVAWELLEPADREIVDRARADLVPEEAGERTADQVRATVAEVAELSAPGSRLVVGYQATSLAIRR